VSWLAAQRSAGEVLAEATPLATLVASSPHLTTVRIPFRVLMDASSNASPAPAAPGRRRGEVFPPGAESDEDGPGGSAGSYTPDSSGSRSDPVGARRLTRVAPSRT
jgi:hypothetical protein